MRLELVALASLIALSGCRVSPTAPSAVLRLCAHAGRESERRVLTQQVRRFNQTIARTPVQLTFLPEGGYNAQVQSAALAHDLPDLLEFDGPFVYSYAWQNCLQPLEAQLKAATVANLLPSIRTQSEYRGHLYCLGNFDSGLGLYARKSLLQQVGARIPSGPDNAWTVDEFEDILRRLIRIDRDGQVLDLKLNYRGEWFTYGFAPILESAGGGLVSESTGRAQGCLDCADSVRALSRLQSWLQQGLVDPNLDDNAFVSGRVALSWVGHWEYPRYSSTWGDDLVLLPLPDWGHGSRTGQGSWNWAMTSSCSHPQEAAQFLEFLLQDPQVLEMSEANGAVPGTLSALAASPLYRPGGALHLFAQQLTGGYAVPRPRTPAYPVITSVFQRALRDILQRAPVAEALHAAALSIDRDNQDNRGYP